MVDKWYRTRQIAFDASPLIYLAKLDAMDVIHNLGITGVVTLAVVHETTRPAVAYRHRDALVIEAALSQGMLRLLELTPTEMQIGADLAGRILGMHRGESEVLAIAIERSIPGVIYERQARAVARALEIDLVDVIELLVQGTSDPALLELRIRQFSELVNMRLKDVEHLLAMVEKGKSDE